MAAAAAAAVIQAQCGKNLTINLTNVGLLVDAVNYKAFREQLELAAFTSSWAPWILDDAIPRPAAVNLTPKEVTDERNAYTLLRKKTEGSSAQHVLRQTARGDAKAGFTSLNHHFNRPTVSGRSNALSNLHGLQ